MNRLQQLASEGNWTAVRSIAEQQANARLNQNVQSGVQGKKTLVIIGGANLPGAKQIVSTRGDGDRLGIHGTTKSGRQRVTCK